MTNVVCEVIGLRKSFSGRVVIAGLNMTVRRGDIVSVTGPSGSGKSTLLNCLGMLERADEGQLVLFGEPAPRPAGPAAMRLLRTKIAYLFQNFALIDNDTVEGNLRLALTYTAHRSSRKDGLVSETLSRVGLPPNIRRQKVYELSGGEQQRVAIARVLLKPCELVLADEPTGSLDRENAAAVIALMRSLVEEEGKTLIVVTHDEEVARLATRRVELRTLERGRHEESYKSSEDV